MESESTVLFSETQRFRVWLNLFLYVSMLAAIGITLWALHADPPLPQERTEAYIGVAIGITIPALLILLFAFLKLETQVRDDGLYIKFTPFHLSFKHFALYDLAEYSARTYRPILEYGGWGIRYSLRNGKAYNVRGNQGMQLVFTNGKKLLIGTQRPDEFQAALDSAASAKKR